jgi:hypothetical protein
VEKDLTNALNLGQVEVSDNKAHKATAPLSHMVKNLDGLGRIDRLDLADCALPEDEKAELAKFLVRVFKNIYRTTKKGRHWFWKGATDGGYGRITVGKMKLQAHRLLYELFIKPIRDGYEVHHSCGLERCVRPDHLVQVSPGLNKRIRDLLADPEMHEQLVAEAKARGDWFVSIYEEGQDIEDLRRSIQGASTKKASSTEARKPVQPVKPDKAVKTAKEKRAPKGGAEISPEQDDACDKLDATERNRKAKETWFYSSWLRSRKRGDLCHRLFSAGIPEHYGPPKWLTLRLDPEEVEHYKWVTTLRYDPENAKHVSLITEVVLAWRRRQRERREERLARERRKAARAQKKAG